MKKGKGLPRVAFQSEAYHGVHITRPGKWREAGEVGEVKWESSLGGGNLVKR